MGILDYRTPNAPFSSGAYTDYYRNYRGPDYQFNYSSPAQQTATSPTSGLLATDNHLPTDGSGGNGYGLDGDTSQASGYAASPSMAANTIANTVASGLLNAVVPGLGTVASLATGNLVDSIGRSVNAPGLLGISSPLGAMQSKAAMDALDAESTAQARAFSTARPSGIAANQGNDPTPGGYSAFGDSNLASDVASGNWGGSADSDAYGGGSLSDSVSSGDWGGSADSDGWKNGGMIRNRRGLLDDQDNSMRDAKPYRGLLDGPVTQERDNLPAVNKTTGEKIAVESGEFVMTRKAVKKKGAKFFDQINRDAENDD